VTARKPPRPGHSELDVRALDIRFLNSSPLADVAAAIGPLFEGAPGFLARLAGARPYADWEALFEVARAIAHGMPEAEQIELLAAHPRLGAPPGTLSAASFREQGHGQAGAARTGARPGGGAASGPVHVAAELERLNDAYEARFGFRYCVNVAGRSRAALLPEMATALEADRGSELHRALDAVVDIAMARLAAARARGG